MYLEYQYAGSIQDLEELLRESIEGFTKIHQSIPLQIARYFPNKQKDYEQIIQNIKETVRNSEALMLKFNSPKLNKNHLFIGLDYINNRLLVSYMDIIKLRVGKAYAGRLLKEDAKLLAINRMVDQMIYSEEGFSTMKKRHKNYEQVMKHVEYITVPDVNEVQHRMKKMGNLLSMSSASVIQSLRHQSLFMRALSFPFNFVKYFVDTDQAEIMVGNYLRKPEASLMQKLWNVGETECIVTTGMKCMFEKVNTIKKIYVPHKMSDLNEAADIFASDPDKIQVRIICPDSIKLYGRSQCCGCLCCVSCPCCVANVDQNLVDYETIMVHIHGGGFVAMSSFSMQNHTRQWANALGIPIFSIDYRLTPQSSFPDALDDCVSVYEFLAHHAHKFMNVRPKKIIVGGDSAGGNLSLALTGFLMKKLFNPLPHGVFLAYPATDFRQKFSPSRINSLDDTLLFTTLLYVCREAYLGETNDEDPLVSPLLLTQQFVNGSNDKKWPLSWPRTRIMVGEKDPLFDDSFELLQRMVISKIDVKCKVYEGMSHGLLNLDMFLPQCRITIQDSIKQLKELLME